MTQSLVVLKAHSHVRTRAWERFGMALHDADIQDIEKKIVLGKGEWVVDQCVRGRLRTVYEVKYRDRRIVAVFDIQSWCVVTLLSCAPWAVRKKRVLVP